jgi:hypothetical protein
VSVYSDTAPASAGRKQSLVRTWVAATVTTLVFGLATAAPSNAALGIAAFDGSVSGPDGASYTQAGGHPYAANTIFALTAAADSQGNVLPDGGGAKDIEVTLPPGFVGDPTVASTCPMDDFLHPISSEVPYALCPAQSQVGVTDIKVAIGQETGAGGDFPVYNLDPSPGSVALFGFRVFAVPVFVDVRVNPADNRIVALSRNTSQALAVLGASVTLWGSPADPLHDGKRVCPGPFGGSPCSIDPSPRPFLTNPTACPLPGSGLETGLRVDSWASPGLFARAIFVSHDPPGYRFAPDSSVDPTLFELPPDRWGPASGPTGCERLPFDPSLSVRPTTTEPDSPSGLSVDLSFPQQGLQSTTGLATAHLKRARVVLPDGMTISPSSADGLAGCSDEQIGVGSNQPVSCPDASKIGTVVATTPVLKEPLEGGVYVGTQESDDPASGRMFRIFLVLENKQRGLLVKLPGQVHVVGDGQLETVFDNNPQLPVSTIALKLKSGARAPLATPLACGKHTVTAQLTSWGGQTVDRESSFEIDCPPGLGGFAPSFRAGSLSPLGGAFGPLVVGIDRPDRQQYLAGVAFAMPGGVSAKLRGVPLCGETDAQAGSCPPETRIGTATVGAGPGPAPYYLKGPVSLTGSYKGAPYGLSVSVRAKAGPFDLGTVVVRQAIYVDPVDASLRVVSDPLPVIVKGVPVRLRSVEASVDRPRFALNPTSCAPKQIAATFNSTQGVTAQQAVRFKVVGCAELGFAPKLSLALTGKGQTADGKHPGLKAVLTQPRGQAAIRSVTVGLPLSLALDPTNAASDSLCEFEEGQKPDPGCPASSIIGHVTATTPLLNRPLVGKVYFVKNVRVDSRTGRRIRTLPTLLLALRGEVALNVRAQTSVKDGKLISTFPTVPDAPVTRFALTLKGGKRGILVVNGNACRRSRKAAVDLRAQNARRAARSVSVHVPCG